MQSLHNLFGQATSCILDLAVLILFCIGIIRIVRDEVKRLRDPLEGGTKSARKLSAGPYAGPANAREHGRQHAQQGVMKSPGPEDLGR
jgi:hypothetical protein